MGLLSKLAQGEGLVPGSQGDPDVGFREGGVSRWLCCLVLCTLALCQAPGTVWSAVSGSGTPAPLEVPAGLRGHKALDSLHGCATF